MSKFLGNRTASKLVMAAAGAVGLLGMIPQAGATLTINLRSGTGASSATVSNGQTISILVYADVKGANTVNDDDWLQSLYGTFNTTGALKGNLSLYTAAGPGGVSQANGFTQNGGQVATTGDFDGDGTIDVGDPSDYTKMFYARVASPDGPSLDEQTDPFSGDPIRSKPHWKNLAPGENEILVGALLFNATNATGSSTINFNARDDSVGGPQSKDGALWWEDDTTSAGLGGPDGAGQKDGSNGIIVGSSFTVNSVPEPASLSVLALASLGLLKRRRRENV